MTEFNLNASIDIDQTRRIDGISDVSLKVYLTATQSPGVDVAALLSRYWYRATLLGFGREKNPPRARARRRTRFGPRVTTLEPRWDRRNLRFEWVPVERILEEHRVRHVASPSGHRAEFEGESTLTVGVEVLDVARARSSFFPEPTTPDPEGADAIFVEVELMDRENDDSVVASAESNVVSDFFGADERTSGGGDDRDFPTVFRPQWF